MEMTREHVRRQNRYVKHLTNREEFALSLIKEVDLSKVEPEFVQCKPGPLLDVFHYFRCAISSEAQSYSVVQGRHNCFLVMDKTSGGLLGVVALGGPPTQWPLLDHYFRWAYDTEYGGRYAPIKGEYIQNFLHMQRCLPLYEFGQMTGGKFLTLTSTSREVVRLHEIRYSGTFLWFTARTTHGRSSQYNRLQQRGLKFIGADDQGRGLYMMELRKKAMRHIWEGVPWGKPASYYLDDQTQYWKDRWLASRCKSRNVEPVIKPDKEQYRLSVHLDGKLFTMDGMKQEVDDAHQEDDEEDDEADTERGEGEAGKCQ